MLDQIANFVSNNLMAASGTAAVALEIALRMFPSEKPMSLLLAASKISKTIGSIFSGIASFLDKVVPQKLK